MQKRLLIFSSPIFMILCSFAIFAANSHEKEPAIKDQATFLKTISGISPVEFAVAGDGLYVREAGASIKVIDTKTDALSKSSIELGKQSIAMTALDGQVFVLAQEKTARGFKVGTAKLVIIDSDGAVNEKPIPDYPSSIAIFGDKVVIAHRPKEVSSFGGVHLSFFDPKTNNLVGPLPVDLQNISSLANVNGRLFLGMDGGHYNKIVSLDGQIAFETQNASIDAAISLRSGMPNYLVGINNLLFAYSESSKDPKLHKINAENPGTIEKSIELSSSITALTSYNQTVLIAFSSSLNNEPKYSVKALDPVTLKLITLVDLANDQAKGYVRALKIVDKKLYVGTEDYGGTNDSVQVFALNVDL